MAEYMQKTFDGRIISKSEVQEDRNRHLLYRTRREEYEIMLKQFRK